MKKIFVTGGAGYIGSHTVLSLLQQDYEVTVFDNLVYGSLDILAKVEALTGKKIRFIKGDLLNQGELAEALSGGYDAVIHFAAYKNVAESDREPLKYFENNISGSINLVKAMLAHNIKNIIFSSSCSVYGQPTELPVTETHALNPLSVYAKTKTINETMLADMQKQGLNSVRLRYFNVAGAEPSGAIGENPEYLMNVIPRIFGAALGKFSLKIYGNKFKTRDGFQIRDYIHVVDLAEAHVAALKYLENNPGSIALNLGTSSGTSVGELITEVEKLTGLKVPYEVIEPVAGDPVEVFGNASKAKEILNWEAKYDYHDIVAHAWNWYKNYPGFGKE